MLDKVHRTSDTRLKKVRFSLVGHDRWTEWSQSNLSVFEGRIGFMPVARLRRYRRRFHRIVQIEYAQTVQLPNSEEDEGEGEVIAYALLRNGSSEQTDGNRHETRENEEKNGEVEIVKLDRCRTLIQVGECTRRNAVGELPDETNEACE